MWTKYEEAIRSVSQFPITCIKSGHGVGKTDVAAIIANWWLDIYTKCFVLTTSSSFGSVSKILNPRIRAVMQEANLFPGREPNDNGLEVNTGKMWIAKSTKISENMQGAHSDNILQIADEATGIEYSTFKGMSGNRTGGNWRMLLISNAIRSSGYFYDLCTSGREDVNVITISSLEHPNVVTGKPLVGGGAITRADIETDLEEYDCKPTTKDDPKAIHIWWLGDKGYYIPTADFMGRVLGEFAENDESTMISRTALTACTLRKPKNPKPTVLGCDVAGRGEDGDETVIALGNRTAITDIEVHRGWDTNEIAERIRDLYFEHDLKMVGVDDTGIGGGVTDKLNDMDVDVMPVIFAESALRDDRFANLKAEIHWDFKRQVENDEEYSLPKDEKLIKQCSSIKKKKTDKNKIIIEKKKEYKQRTGESPDRAEAVIICHHVARVCDEGDDEDSLDPYITKGDKPPKSGEEGFNPYGGGVEVGQDDEGPKGGDYWKNYFG